MTVATSPTRRSHAAEVTRRPAASEGPPRTISLEEIIETPECVQMSFVLAGPAARCAAYALDTLLRGAILIMGAAIMLCMGMNFPGLSAGFILVLLFLLEWGYFAFFEWMWSGRTIGKKAMGIRVIESYGYPLSPWSALVRNFVRAIDSIGLYGPSLVSMALSGRMQRLGDLAAGSIVIHETPVRLPTEPIILDTIRPIDRAEINSFVPSERTLTLIDQMLSRRTNSRQRIPHARGHALAHDLAIVLARRLNYTGDWEQVRTYSMAFLARVYVTFLRPLDDEPARSADVRRTTKERP